MKSKKLMVLELVALAVLLLIIAYAVGRERIAKAPVYPEASSTPAQVLDKGTSNGVSAGGSDDSPVAEVWGSIYGSVFYGPVCPVERDPPDPDCADRPYQTRLALTTTDGSRVVKEFSSDSEGKFYIDVPPGTYAIRSALNANVLPYCSSNGTITVRVNEGTHADVSCDSGIR